jgi:endonuclease-3 related protein
MPKARQNLNLPDYYRRLRAAFGHQDWWPGDTPFEVCVGAILTQNTAWTNVERAIANLKRARKLSVRAIHTMPHAELAALIRPAGYFNIKAKRLQNFVEFVVNQHGASLERMFATETMALRQQLLTVNGIGPETADSILLYAGNKPIFVVDAYTKRVLVRHGVVGPDATYDDIQRLFSPIRGRDTVAYYNDFHAQIVAVAKEFCHARMAHCAECPLRALLPPV